ncbi:MAG: CDP-glucose 4,6-dehydratase [Caldisericia bacterium]|nr:CDP-glucose 4,6-dehydratase [Caldisericia bacterium]
MFKGIVFYNGKKVLVTGNTGFKGSWLTQWLIMIGADVTGFSIDVPTKPSLFSTLDLSSKIHDVRGDIRNIDEIEKCIQDTDPDIIFHLAAQSIVGNSYKDPLNTFSTNAIGTVNLLEAIRRLKNNSKIQNLKSVIAVTSDKCYENKEQFEGYRETDPMGGYDPYSASKGCAELVISSYQKSFFRNLKVGLASVRAGNVIGGGDWADGRLIPDLVKAFSKKERLIIRKPNSVRPWQHVLDPLYGYLKLAHLLYNNPEKYSQSWNFGPEYGKLNSAEEIAKVAINYWPGNSYSIEEQESFHEAGLLQLDIHKAVALLGWTPIMNTEKAIQNTIEWYKTYYLDGVKKSKELIIEQITEYDQCESQFCILLNILTN